MDFTSAKKTHPCLVAQNIQSCCDGGSLSQKFLEKKDNNKCASLLIYHTPINTDGSSKRDISQSFLIRREIAYSIKAGFSVKLHGGKFCVS